MFSKFNIDRQDRIICISLIFFAYLMYSPSLLFNFFIMDDYFHIINSDFVNKNTFSALLFEWPDSLHPLPYKAWQTISFIFGTDNPIPYRFINILLHGINGALLYNLLSSFFRGINFWEETKQTKIFTGFIVALFLAHPANVESIVWTSSFRGTFAAFWTLLAFKFAIRSTFEKEEKPLWTYFFMTLFFVFSLLSKMIVAPAVFIFMLIDFYFKKDKSFYYFITKYSLILSFLLIALFVAEGKIYEVFRQHEIVQLNQGRSWVIPASIFDNIKRMFFPGEYYFQRLPPIYFFSFQDLGINVLAFILVYASLAIFLTFLATKKGLRPIFVLFFASFLFLLPSSGIVSFNFQKISIVADRYLYLPLMFSISGVILLLYKITSKYIILLNTLKTLVFILLLCATARSVTDMRLWQYSSDVLKSSIDRKGPPSDGIAYPYIAALSKEGYDNVAYRKLKEYYLDDMKNNQKINDWASIKMGVALLNAEIHFSEKRDFVKHFIERDRFSFKKDHLEGVTKLLYNYGDLRKAKSFANLYIKLTSKQETDDKKIKKFKNYIRGTKINRLFYSNITLANHHRRKGEFNHALKLANEAKRIMENDEAKELIKVIKRLKEEQSQ